MKLRGKRWLYQIEGRPLSVENAWSWSLWAQERVVLGGRALRKTGGYLCADRSFSIPPEESGLTEYLHVSLYSGFFRINCIVTLGDTILEPDRIEFGDWRAERGAWPNETAAA
jgi:hypothetical protein